MRRSLLFKSHLRAPRPGLPNSWDLPAPIEGPTGGDFLFFDGYDIRVAHKFCYTVIYE